MIDVTPAFKRGAESLYCLGVEEETRFTLLPGDFIGFRFVQVRLSAEISV